MMRKKHSTGFSLIELMIGLAIAAIVLTLGVPSFSNMIENNQLTTRTNEFMTALTIARSEAVKRGVPVTVCKSTNGADCDDAAAGYEAGWVVFVDDDNDGVRDAGEDLLRVRDPLAAGYTLRGASADGIDDFITYAPAGTSSAGGANSVFALCKDADTTKSREIIVSTTGRAYVDGGDASDCMA